MKPKEVLELIAEVWKEFRLALWSAELIDETTQLLEQIRHRRTAQSSCVQRLTFLSLVRPVFGVHGVAGAG